jgi:hypothetical protein
MIQKKVNEMNLNKFFKYLFLFLFPTFSFAQLEYFYDDFEEYIVNLPLACQNPNNWTTWNNLPCDPIEDPYLSSNHSYSGSKSVVIVYWNDLIKPLGNVYIGRNIINFNVYIPSGKTGYTSILSKFIPDPKEWGVDCYFDVNSVGRLMRIPGEPVYFNYTNNQWHFVRIVIDFNIDEAQFWFDYNLIHLWQWSQNGTITSQLAAQNFYGELGTSEMYIDDYSWGEIFLSSDPPYAPSNLTTQQIFNPEPLVQLSWQDNSWNENVFKIIRKSGLPNDPSSFEFLSIVPQNVTQYIDSNVVIDSTYTYGVLALNMFGYSDTSNTSSITIDPVTNLKENINTILSFTLAQNFPNPFNPTTKIKYTIPTSTVSSPLPKGRTKEGFITLKVYDVLGNELSTLVNEEKPAGEYETEFVGTGLPSGIYFYQLRAGSYLETKKMVLLR